MVDGHDLTLITAGLSAITLIAGFVVFAATRRAIPFDRRLILSGYRPAALITAKMAAALAVAAAVGGYAAVVILAFWRPAGLWSIAVAFILAAASYAALGLLVGVLVRGDLEGFFLIIMTALLDTFLENPVDNPLANKPILEFFPSYGPTQFAAAGAFHHQVLPGMVVVSLAWTAAFALLGLAVLWLRMPRYSLRRTEAGRLRAAASPGSAAITTAAASQPLTSPTAPTDGTATTGGDAELMREDQPARPAADDPGRNPDHQGQTRQRDALPGQRPPDLPGGEAEHPQDREVTLPPPYRGDQQMADGQQRRPRPARPRGAAAGPAPGRS